MTEIIIPCGCGCLPLKQEEGRKTTTIEASTSTAKTVKEEKDTTSQTNG